MAIKKFSLEAIKDTKPKGTLTSFVAPKVAQPSYQTTPQEMVARQQAAKNILSNLKANIYQSLARPKAKPVEQPSYSEQFVGSGGNAALGRGTNVSGQAAKKPIATPLVTEEADLSASSANGVSGEGSSGGGASPGGGYTPPAGQRADAVDTDRPSPKTVNIGSQGELDKQLQKLADTDPELADSIMDSLGYTKDESSASKFEQGFDRATRANLDSTQVSSDAQGRAVVQQYAPSAPSKRNDLPTAYIQTDPYINGLVTAWQQYIDPKNQRASLADTYKQMLKDTGIQAIDTELLDMKNVIEGSEEDIRTEVTKAGGFASESQIQALTNARNKQLIKNYNTLLETRNSKEKYLQTAIQLEATDRQTADQRFESMFNMGLQIANYSQQMQTNARQQMQWLSTNIGFDGLYNATNGDSYYTGLIEQTLGLPQGGLLSAANQARLVKARAEEKRQLELEESRLGLDVKRGELAMQPLEMQKLAEQIKTERAQRAKIVADTQKIIDASKGTIFDLTTPEGRKQAALGKSQIDQVDAIISSGNLNTAVGPNIFSRFGKVRNIFRPGTTNFIADVEQLRSQLNLQSLIDAKAKGATFGALSDQELRVLSNAATKLGSWAIGDRDQFGNITNVTGYKAKESDFKKELDKINNFAKLDYIYRGGNSEDVSVQVIDGKYYTRNSDGSVTEL